MTETKRQLQKKSTRKRLLEAAIRHFSERGLTTARTADIAKAAGVAHGTVFVHFPTQELLLASAIDEFGSRINMRLHELAAGKRGVRDVLEAHMDGLMEFEDFYARLVVEGPLLPDEARNTFIMIQSTVSFHICQAAEREIEAGTILPQPVHMIFNGWLGLLHYYLANSDLFSPGESVLKHYGRDLIRYYMSLITIEKHDGHAEGEGGGEIGAPR
jgi:AcrR family transcriptional regulator